ncbi:MAG: 4Fe-4S dicluster domain-containing protein [Candidatus Scalindua sp.]|nr:4Fe-4S dicluster domain-containing protein [Candidatus Scalindua sp.]
MNEETIDQGRRLFFKETFSFVGNKIHDVVKNKIDLTSQEKPYTVIKARRFLRPPGSVPENEFLSLCTKCDECIKVCPHKSIRRVNEELDISYGTPMILPEEVPCYLCEGFPCIKACKEGALVEVQDKGKVRMGHAYINESHCMAWGAQFCEHCVRSCPIPGAIYQDDNRPLVDREKCVGCGICENICNTVNQPIAIKVAPVHEELTTERGNS